MDFYASVAVTRQMLFYALAIVLLLFMIWLMVKGVVWAKKRPVGAYLMLTVLPLISLFPIPSSEIKKLQQIKQQQVQQKEQSGEPPNDDLPKHKPQGRC